MNSETETLIDKIKGLERSMSAGDLEKALRAGGYSEAKISDLVFDYKSICDLADEMYMEDL